MSLLKLNKLFRIKISRQKGVSLIELMVAVAILSAVSFGIFKSFQVGFWGMNDARARTIAVNLAQEKLEWVKGKALGNGQFPDPDNPIKLSGKDFNVIYVVKDMEADDPASSPSPQSTQNVLKKISTTVSWQKRDGTEATILIEGLQSKTEIFYQDKPTSILINIIPKEITIGEVAEITVTILDQDNYPIPSFKGHIQLTMDPDKEHLGTIDAVDGYLVFDGDTSNLKTYFRANTVGDAGSVFIYARDIKEDLAPDSEEIIITGGEATQIVLEATPDSILINGDKSKITIKILDENDYLAENWTGEIELKIISGEETGYLGDNPSSGTEITVEFNEENIKTIWFTSTDKDGVAEIEATDKKGKLKSGEVTIDVTSGPPFKIDVKAEPNNVIVGGDSLITITILNETETPVSGFEGKISLSIIEGSNIGSLEETEFEFNGEKYLTTTFTAWNTPGDVVIKAEDKTSATPLDSGTVKITVAIGPPATIEIDASPKMIVNTESETGTSFITVTLKDSSGNPSSFDVEKDLNFTIEDSEKGTISPSTIKLPAGYSSNTDIPVTFSCDDKNYDGDVTIFVNCPDSPELGQGEVTVQVVSRIVRPADDPDIRYGTSKFLWFVFENRKKILFDIEVVGDVIDITQIDLAWEGNQNTEKEKLKSIKIYEKGNTSEVKIVKTWSNPPTVNVITPPEITEMLKIREELEGAPPTRPPLGSLTPGEYTVELEFDMDVTRRKIVIHFYGSYEGKTYIYEMEFASPDIIV